ncbi:ST3 beta-galactoside alpha-2,3-sialyltransferase 8 [Trichomycterus rosablanca]|uniref:ST3 beta-galactoside alpha-2,3-sialyltransferase 8 n=1 Tax=Trichomycterus rosablanca TaxID=2290929 RepID=UPI002F35957B
MLLKKKLCICALSCLVLFFMIVSYTIQKNIVQDTPSTTRTIVKLQQVQQRMCSCSTCVAEPGVSKWFDKRYNQSQQPFLTTGKNKIDSYSLKWWLALQQSGDSTINEVIREMFKVVSPPNGKEINSDRCQRCAVVGNSGNLLHYKYGSMIDSHSFVFRMNKATTVGFEQFVGNKTTHHIMYPESAVDLASDVHLVLLPFKLRDIEWLTSALSTGKVKTTYMRVKDFVKADKDKVMVVNPGFLKYTYDNWTEHHGRYPSTGILAIVFALHLCDEVSVFGYGADTQGNWHHYWENNKYAGAFRMTGVHNADFEHKVIQMLSAEGKIKLYTKAKKKLSEKLH